MLLGAIKAKKFVPWLRSNGPIGVDFSLSYLHMIQLARLANGSIQVTGRASIAHPCSRDELLHSPALLKKQIARGLREGRFHGRRAILAMPASEFKTMSVNYRTPKGVTDDAAIISLMRERLDGPLEDYVVDYMPVSAQVRDAEKLAIVAVSPRTATLQFLGAIAATGLKVQALEIGPMAICRLASAMPDSDSQLTLIITSGQKRSYLTLLSGDRLLMDQQIDFSEELLLTRLSNALDMSRESAMEMIRRTGVHAKSGMQLLGHKHGETGIFNTLLEILKPDILRLVEEIDRVFMYAAAQARGGGKARICLLGSLARWRGFDQVVSGFTNLPLANLASPLRLFGADAEESELNEKTSEPEFAVATGLALKSLLNHEKH